MTKEAKQKSLLVTRFGYVHHLVLAEDANRIKEPAYLGHKGYALDFIEKIGDGKHKQAFMRTKRGPAEKTSPEREAFLEKHQI